MPDAEFQWTQDSWWDDRETREGQNSRRNERFVWLGVIAVAVLAFEVTADPALTVFVGCLKFGWDEFRLARWLKRTDPDRRRGKTCSRFYLAWGLWRVSVVAIAVAFILVFAHAMVEGNQGNRGVPAGFISAMLVSLLGFTLSSMVSSLAVISALRYRVKVWLGPEARWAREENAWPPHTVARRRPTSNRTKAILLSALITAFMFGVLIFVLPLAKGFPQQKPNSVLPFVLFMIVLIGSPVWILVLLESLGERMIAPTPEACWASPEDSVKR